jgi:hypothetical protein
MNNTVATKEQSAVPVGYTVQSVITRIAALDIDAAGNAEKAAWKRYTGLACLSIAKAWDKKKVVELVFGKGAKPSKTFQNMWSLAEKARNNMVGNRSWAEIKLMPIEEALDTAIMMLNAHMAVLSCSSKNEYEKFCNLSPSEAEDKRKQEVADKAAAKSEAEAATAQAADTQQVAEDDATAKADALPERTAAQAAMAALHEASRDDLMDVLSHIVTRIGTEDLTMVRDQLTAILANMAAQAEAATQAA